VSRLARTIVVLLYLGGLSALWWFTPPGPREGWQIPRDEMVVGFVGHESKLVTVPRLEQGLGFRRPSYVERGPIRVWEAQTGSLVAQWFVNQGRTTWVSTYAPSDLILLHEEDVKQDSNHRLRVHDASAGRSIAEHKSPAALRILSRNGRYAAYSQTPWLYLFDLATGRKLCEIKPISFPVFVSEDGKYVVTSARTGHEGSDGAAVAIAHIWIAESGKLHRELLAQVTPGEAHTPKEFSPDGSLLLDTKCRVWDLETGKVRFEVPGIHHESSLFSACGRHLIVLKNIGQEAWLVYYDTATGQKSRSLLLTKGDILSLELNTGTLDRRYIIASGVARNSRTNWALQWLAKIPAFRSFAGEPNEAEFIVIETETGREVTRGGTFAWYCSPDGKFLVTASREGNDSLWDNPARKPYRLLTLISLGWTAPFALAWWRVRRRHKRRDAALAASHTLLPDQPPGGAT
jgi:WD40 repeat protein